MLKRAITLFTAMAFMPLMTGMNVFAAETLEQSALTQSTSNTALTTKERAALWQISEEEFLTYTRIMEGPLKHWSPNIDPVLALGIFADSEAEKNRFAEIYAQQEYHLTQQTLAFERRYRAAFRRLYPDAEMIEPALMAPYHAHQGKRPVGQSSASDSPLNLAQGSFIEGDRIVYFADGHCRDCQTDIDQLQQLVTHNPAIAVDVFITQITDQTGARRWARAHNVDIALVNDARVTINVDDGAHKKLNAATQQDTHFFLHRHDKVYAVSRADIFSQ